ncbi:MAG: hypothetical protein AAFV85_26790 [Cyanobacteria bacterium J06634_6]
MRISPRPNRIKETVLMLLLSAALAYVSGSLITSVFRAEAHERAQTELLQQLVNQQGNQ